MGVGGGGAGGTAVTANPKAVAAVDLQEIGGLLQQPRHRGIVHRVRLPEQYRTKQWLVVSG
jgi:hypothetical protein